MTDFRKVALVTAVCALGIFGQEGNLSAKPNRSTWGEQCKGQETKQQRENCCRGKERACVSKCYEGCNSGDLFRDYACANGLDGCIDRCLDFKSQCSKDVARGIPGRGASSRSPGGKILDRRVCCRTGIRHGWAEPRKCGARGGKVVNGRFCRNPARKTNSERRRICCKTGRSFRMMPPQACRTAKGRAVNPRYCTLRKRKQERHR